MYRKFQAWAEKNYGDSGKTKTVTWKKYRRIVNVLTGEEAFTSDNSKFRCWVKTKGFLLSPGWTDGEGQMAEQYLMVPAKHGVRSVCACLCCVLLLGVDENGFLCWADP